MCFNLIIIIVLKDTKNAETHKADVFVFVCVSYKNIIQSRKLSTIIWFYIAVEKLLLSYKG